MNIKEIKSLSDMKLHDEPPGLLICGRFLGIRSKKSGEYVNTNIGVKCSENDEYNSLSTYTESIAVYDDEVVSAIFKQQDMLKGKIVFVRITKILRTTKDARSYLTQAYKLNSDICYFAQKQ